LVTLSAHCVPNPRPGARSSTLHPKCKTVAGPPRFDRYRPPPMRTVRGPPYLLLHRPSLRKKFVRTSRYPVQSRFTTGSFSRFSYIQSARFCRRAVITSRGQRRTAPGANPFLVLDFSFGRISTLPGGTASRTFFSAKGLSFEPARPPPLGNFLPMVGRLGWFFFSTHKPDTDASPCNYPRMETGPIPDRQALSHGVDDGRGSPTKVELKYNLLVLRQPVAEYQ